MAQFTSGQDKPLGSGRKKGSKNKTSQHLVDVLDGLNFSIPERLIDLLPKLSEEKQAEVLLQLMNFVYPKRKATEVSLTDQNELKKPSGITTIQFVDPQGKRMSVNQTQYGWDDKDY